MAEQRPDPDALLARTLAAGTQPRRGRLKIFLGMCAGVGKTYAMLQEAQERRRTGIDVVVGYVETHGRAETDALLAGLDALPPRWIDHRGVRLREFDIEATLARRPALLLLDELAHTNDPQARHPKRWQDVVELLDSGIDVYSAVNIQHVDSLNDVVGRITGVAVRETVPDAIFERADEIELIDIAPDELLERLRQGKVYVADQARQAIERFFRPEHLVALRELALRKAAERVSAQVQLARAGRGDTRPWATAERILVCVGPSPLSARVVRTARRMASAAGAEWFATHVETPGLSEKARAQARRNLHLAERLGAQTAVLNAERVAEELIAFAVRHNISKIVIGKPDLARWREWLRGSIVDELIRRSGEIDVHVVKGEPEDAPRPRPAGAPRSGWKDYAGAAAIMLGCTAIAAGAYRYFSAANLTMVYLAGVVFAATRYTAGPCALASVLAAFLFNFLFTEPFYSLSIADGQLLVAFFVLLGTSLVISGLAQRIRWQNEAARTRYLRTIALYFMSRQLAAEADEGALARAAAKHIADVFDGDVVVLCREEGGGLQVLAQSGAFAAESGNERSAAVWVFDHQQWAGWSTETLPAVPAIFLPLAVGGRRLGVLGLSPRDATHVLEPDQRHILETFATQLAIALERAILAQQAESARREAQAEQVRSALLSTISHDLRTPLATIAGSASALAEIRGASAPPNERELLQSIADEAFRLNQLVGKLLDMTRLESSGFRLQHDWYPADELVGAALHRLEAQLDGRQVHTVVEEGLPLLYVDGVLIETVLANLLENAARYTPAGSPLTIQAGRRGDEALVEVLDRGPGLAPERIPELFQRFVRHRPATDRAGVGLGLAICAAVIRLHGGSIGAENRPNGGARFWFTVPLHDAPISPDEVPDGAEEPA